MDYFLARLPVFRGLPPESLERLSQALKLRSFDRGQAVFRDGDPPDSVYLLKSGLVKAVKLSPREEPVIMELIAPGTLFGMIAVLDRKSYPVTAQCVAPSEAYRIATADFDDLMKRYPDFAREVYAEVGRHLRDGQALRAMNKEPAERRIMFILWLLSQSVGKELPVRREDIADMAGTTPETAIRALAELREKKLIAARWKKITVLQPARLKALSQPD